MPSLICCACSNGCALSISRQDAETLLVDGQACGRGVSYAYRQLHEHEPGKYIPKNKQNYDSAFLGPLLGRFGYTLQKVLSGASIQGSPDRSLFRTVVQTAPGKFILEEIAQPELAKRQRIAKNLEYLHKTGFPVVPYVGNTYQEYAGRYWQMSPYIVGIPLERSNYWREAWRGKAVAAFLAELYREAPALQPDGTVFSLQEYSENLWQTMRIERPDIHEQLQEVRHFLENDFFPLYKDIPVGFCHGDPHPLNMLWGEKKIEAVIDWEFSGLKPVLYDAALIIGCVGVEHPQAYQGDFLQAFRQELTLRKVFSPESIQVLPLFVLALRFAWVSEWLRRNDEEMLQFEVSYMRILLQQVFADYDKCIY